MSKEIYWSRFANDFEERNNYVVGKDDLNIIFKKIVIQKNLKNLLELGCGNGTFTKKLYKNADKIIATDYSDEMISELKNRLSTMENIKILKADAFNLDFDEKVFDTVFMANLLHIIPNPDKVLAECQRVLKIKGRVIIVSYTMTEMTFLNKLKMIYRYIKTYGKPAKNATNLTIEGLSKMLEDTGFKIEEIEILGQNMKAIFVVAQKR